MICRLCIKDLSNEEAVQLFATGGKEEETMYVQIINKHFMLEVCADDSISTSICKDCSTHLEDFHNFQSYVQQQQDNLFNELLSNKCVDIVMPKEEEDDYEEDCHNREFLFVDVEQKNMLKENQSFCNPYAITQNEQFFKCDICKYRAEQFQDFVLHYKEIHKQHIANHSSLYIIYACTICENKYHSHRLYNTHKCFSEVTTKSNASLTQCSFCSQTFSNYKLLTRHIISWHPSRLCCPCCDRGFYTKNHLHKHLLSEHGIDKTLVNCTLCFKSFTTKKALRDHVTNHTVMECQICLQGVDSQETLDRHVRLTHVRQSIFRCFRCLKSFETQSCLEEHIIEHKNSKNFVCSICKKQFKNIRTLRSHLSSYHKDINKT